MKPLRSLIVAMSLGIVMTVLPGCAALSTWWQDFKTNPVAEANQVTNYAHTIESSARVAFTEIVAQLPASQQAVWQSKFNASIVTLNDSIAALLSAVQAAADLQQSNPDISGVIASVISAVSSVQAVVADVKNLLATPAPGGNMAARPPMTVHGFDSMNQQAAALKAHLSRK